MVDFNGINSAEAVSTPKTELKKLPAENKGTNVVPITSGKIENSGKGTAVQRSAGNPFYEETDFEHFDGLGGAKMTQADSATKRVKGELARLYNEVKRVNPEAVENLEFPPLPSVPKKGKKDLKLEAYLSALDQYRATCEELLEGVGKQTVVDEVRGTAEAVTSTVVAIGNANMAATLGVGEAMLSGLGKIYNKIDTDTHTILSAVDSNGNKILRAINKQTGEIKQFIAQDGDKTRLQQFLNTVALDRNISAKIDGVHRHIDQNGEWIIHRTDEKIDAAEQNINKNISKSERHVKEHVSNEHDKTRGFTKKEIEEHAVFWHGIPDPAGLLDRIFR
ncbi:MAG: hypothetical protein NC390_00400 [Fusobacterium sp.]|nr:hypothetical protein [Fusobacterium sp.]